MIVWQVITDKVGRLFFNTIDEALLGTIRLKAMGYTAKISPTKTANNQLVVYDCPRYHSKSDYLDYLYGGS